MESPADLRVREAISNAHANAQAHSHNPIVVDSMNDCPNCNVVDPVQPIKVWDSQGEKLRDFYRVKLDTAAHANVIIKSLVEKCGYKLYPGSDSDPSSLVAFNEYRVPVIGWVKPDWQFAISVKKRRRKDVRFGVIDKLPSGLHMLLGEEFLQETNIQLRSRGDVLVLQRDWVKGS